ncbi:MAG: 16S rRNA (cytosine(967)-C(5))-methyltransferase RsmB [Peptococcaceae bacterium]|nr:16S rRNA (cytosine(967)-C(5))-methyltransferase RsmB [Peptococcaceae bacterium]
MMKKQDKDAGIKNKRINEMNARQVAVRILTRVEKEGAYATLLLRTQLTGMEDVRERNLATALVNGVLKNKSVLDYALRKHLTKPMSALPYEVRAVLRTGAFQVLFLDKIPGPVAINESVNVTKWINPNYVSLVNSVLRKTAQIGWSFQWPDKNKELLRYLAIKYSHPEWMVSRWLKRWGAEETEELLQADNHPSPTCIRVNTLKTTPENLQAALMEKGIKVQRSSRVPESLYIEDFGAIEKLEVFTGGHMTVQDESSQLVAHILDPAPGDRVLDVCSAPGGKTTHLAQIMKNTGQIIAVDLYPQKLQLVNELARRLGITIIHTIPGDARELEGIEGKFNRVLVDAPCSGLGVIRRRADLRWQKREDEIKKLPELQLAILMKASEYVLPGGELVYSTCTTEPEENFEVVKAFRKMKPEFEPVDISQSLPFEVTEERDLAQLKKGVWQILPHHHRMDGFFLSKMKLMM